MAIEKNAKEAVEAEFADELKNGTLVFRTIDISEPKNEAIAEKYEVTWSSLFISKWKAGKETYENLTEYAFANARTAPATFKNGVAEKVRTLLKQSSMEWLQTLLDSSTAPALTAFLLGLLTAISPCPLATSIAAIGFIGKDIETRRRIFLNGLL